MGDEVIHGDTHVELFPRSRSSLFLCGSGCSWCFTTFLADVRNLRIVFSPQKVNHGHHIPVITLNVARRRPARVKDQLAPPLRIDIEMRNSMLLSQVAPLRASYIFLNVWLYFWFIFQMKCEYLIWFWRKEKKRHCKKSEWIDSTFHWAIGSMEHFNRGYGRYS